MKVNQILTRRHSKGQNYAQPIIYEWEDIISKELSAPIKMYPFIYKIVHIIGKHTNIFGPYQKTFRFVINGKDYDSPMNSKHIIPCIIDFFEKDENLSDFYRKHSKNPIVLVSSPFDYQYLKEKKCPLRVELFPYSLSDKYAITGTHIEKKYDIVLTGRQDPMLYNFFKEYIKKHPDVTYVKRGKDLDNDEKKTQDYYVNCEVNIGSLATREEFIKLQSQGRVTLYGVQGYDSNTQGFFHMTPHFLEIIASGCHVLMHYPTDANGVDAKFYEFHKFSPSIESYEAFEKAMNHALKTDVDLAMYSSYMKKHYTSYRARQLKELLRSIK